MKIAFEGLDLPEGKAKYDDRIVTDLAEKFQPAKVSPYYVEFLRGAYDTCEATAISRDSLLDLLILDIEKLEGRLERSEDETEKVLVARCLAELEGETPLCDVALSDEEKNLLVAIGSLSIKPTAIFDDASTGGKVVTEQVLEKAGKMFFYTAGKQEVHAWLMDQGATAVECAGKIHSDLARGFVKAISVTVDDLMTTHNMQSARSEGIAELVGREHPVEKNTVLEILFSV